MAIDLQNEIANDDAIEVELRRLTFAWVTTELNAKLQCRIYGTEEGHDIYGRHFRINRDNYVQSDPIEAYRRYGHALELRVGHHANTWNYHHHIGVTEVLEHLFLPRPFEEAHDKTMTMRWSSVYNKLRNLPYDHPTAAYTPLREYYPSASQRDVADSYSNGAIHIKIVLEDLARLLL